MAQRVRTKVKDFMILMYICGEGEGGNARNLVCSLMFKWEKFEVWSI